MASRKPDSPSRRGRAADRSRKGLGAAREHQRRPSSRSLGGGDVCAPGNGPHTAKSRDGARPSASGAGPSKIAAASPEGDARASRTPTPVPTARSSQTVCDERRHHAEDPGRRHGKSPERHSRDVEDLPARRSAGGNGMRPRDRDRAPPDMVRSRSTSRSVQVSLPLTLAEALARAVAPRLSSRYGETRRMESHHPKPRRSRQQG